MSIRQRYVPPTQPQPLHHRAYARLRIAKGDRRFRRDVSPVLASRMETVAEEIESMIARIDRTTAGGYSVLRSELLQAQGALLRARQAVQVDLFPGRGLP